MKKIILIVLPILVVLCGAIIICLYQFTELFGKKILPTKIETISIRYAPGCDLGDADRLNTDQKTFIEVQTIKLTDGEQKIVKNALKKVRGSEEKWEKSPPNYYEVIINDSITLRVGNKKGIITQGEKDINVTIPSSTMKTIQEIIDKNNEKILENISFEDVTFRLDGASIHVADKDNLEYLKGFVSYYPIVLEEDYKTYQNGYQAEMIFDTGVKVYLYQSNIGYILQNDGEKNTSSYVIFTHDLYDSIHLIYQESIE